MSDDYYKNIEIKCEEALNQNDEFTAIQRLMAEAYIKKDIETYSELSIRLQIIVERISYQTAFNDQKS